MRVEKRLDGIDTTVNRQCIFINPDTNEIMVNNLDAWRYVRCLILSLGIEGWAASRGEYFAKLLQVELSALRDVELSALRDVELASPSHSQQPHGRSHPLRGADSEGEAGLGRKCRRVPRVSA